MQKVFAKGRREGRDKEREVTATLGLQHVVTYAKHSQPVYKVPTRRSQKTSLTFLPVYWILLPKGTFLAVGACSDHIQGGLLVPRSQRLKRNSPGMSHENWWQNTLAALPQRSGILRCVLQSPEGPGRDESTLPSSNLLNSAPFIGFLPPRSHCPAAHGASWHYLPNKLLVLVLSQPPLGGSQTNGSFSPISRLGQTSLINHISCSLRAQRKPQNPSLHKALGTMSSHPMEQ